MEYLLLPQSERDDVVAQNILGREREHYAYSLNISNYEAMLASDELKDLGEWPENLVAYQALSAEDLAKALSGEDFTLASKLQYRDRVQLLLKTEQTERDKGLRTYNALLEQLPAGEDRDAAFARLQPQ